MRLHADSFQRRRRLVAGGRAGNNSGTCASCGKDAPWRSVNNRCRSCEVNDVKTRTPMYIDKDVLKNASGDSNSTPGN